jgi:anti-sigma regulatory factor (Ser/Thr protein kinase)
MPFNALPAQGFLNRESELDYLKGLVALKDNALGGNVFLEGARGTGKTELLKQHYRSLFREDHAVPFYYSFKTANLKGTYFARDYFSSFVRQYISFIKKDPAIAENTAGPLHRLTPLMASLGLHWLMDGVEDLQSHVNNHDVYGQMVAAISAPVMAAQRGSRPVVVLLDDFDAAQSLYESNLGDAHGLVSLFGEPMKHKRCPHVMTGAAGTLAAIFTDHALIGMTEQMRLGPLPDDLAERLFRTHLAHLNVACAPAGQLDFLRILKGNPLYLRNIAKAVWKMQKKDISERDLVEGYAYDVSNGETAFYWSSTLSRCAKTPAERKILLKGLIHAMDNGVRNDGAGRPLMSGLHEAETKVALDAMSALGMTQDQDTVFRDVIRCLYMKEVEGRNAGDAWERIVAKYLAQAEESCFEMVIPMSSDAELVVAKAVEQIGKNIHLDDEFLNYLQLALIEVCINAIEHSGSYEKKVFLKFTARADQIEIIVENAGRPFSLDARKEIPVEEKLRMGMKRGWGFKLVHSIMDDVKIERVNDRTRVILIKNIIAKEVHSS